MKNLLLTTLLSLLGFMSLCQLPYSWTIGVDPGWISNSNIIGQPTRVLNYQPILGYVSSSDLPAGNRYVNSQITSYTSPNVNTTCINASTVSVSINIDVFLENTYDWGYFQYSLNGGTTWINPVILNGSNNNSGVNLLIFSPLTNWSNNNSNRNGWTNSFFTTLSYIIPSSSNSKFRFIFASDISVNYSFFSDYYLDIIDFTINCNPALPIELISFDGHNKSNNNILTWSTATENNNDYFTVERSDDGVSWSVIDTVDGAGNSQLSINYSLVDNNYKEVINYYRLKQVDYDGKSELFEKIIAIDNRILNKKVVRITNLLGQDIDEYYKGVVIILYSDGSTKKRVQ